MTAPFPQLPNISQGNIFQDIGSAVSSFAKGLQAERARRREEAMQTAMMQLQMAKLMQPERPFHEIAIDPTTQQLTHIYRDPRTMQEVGRGGQAPTSQWFYPGEGGEPYSVSRHIPGAPATPVPGAAPQASQPPSLVKGQPVASGQPTPNAPKMRDVAPSTQVVEGPGGPGMYRVPPRAGAATPVLGPGGKPIAPRADEQDERRARDAFEMIQAKDELVNIALTRPQAYDEAAAYLSSRNFLDAIPILGGPLDAALAASQSALSPETAMYVRAFTQLASARAFARGGATLTANEIRWAMDAIQPKAFADPTVREGTERLINTILIGLTVGNPAWQRYSEYAKQLGWDSSSALIQAPPVAPQPDVNRLTGRPRRQRRQ